MLLRLSREDERVIPLGVSESIAGFHAQQSIEKALKAVLTHWGLPYAFTHNLSELVSQIGKTGLFCQTLLLTPQTLRTTPQLCATRTNQMKLAFRNAESRLSGKYNRKIHP
jgi:hypothetical protein